MNTHDRIVTDPELTQITGLGRSQRRKLEARDLFPTRRLLSPDGRKTGNLMSELQTWIAGRPQVQPPAGGNKIGKGKAGPGKGHKKQLSAP